MQKLLLASQEKALLANGRWNRARAERWNECHEDPADFRPVVKLFCPWGAATWLLTELDPDDPDIAFGLCDLGQGFPEIGSVSLSELRSIRHRSGLCIERDAHFRATKTLSEYAAEARACGGIAA